MKNIVLLAAFTAIGLFSFAQNEKVIKDANAQARSVSGFHAIHVSGGIDLYLSQSSAEAVAISASSSETRDRIRTEVVDGVLRIYLENDGFHWRNWGDRKMKAYVSCKVLDGLKASGGSDVYIEDAVKSDKLGIDLSGGSDLRGKVDSHDLTITQSGGSDSYISGSASHFSIHASGGSDFHGKDFNTDESRVEASGGSDVHVVVNKELTVNASGGSDVYYSGSGALKESHVSGSATVSRKG
ncbi:MAG TPA: head GIN domain-containing protein [Puia sp.]|nr:head GIN domain-containing protein [Puia sp.]